MVRGAAGVAWCAERRARMVRGLLVACGVARAPVFEGSFSIWIETSQPGGLACRVGMVPAIAGLKPKRKVVLKPRKRTRPWAMPTSIAMLQRKSIAWLKVATRFRRRCVEAFAQMGLTLHEIAILSCLNENGPMFHNDLALRVGIDKAKLVPIAAGLMGASLVGLDSDMPDRRRTQIEVTWRGRDLLKDINARFDQLESELFASLSDQERQILSKVAARLLEVYC